MDAINRLTMIATAALLAGVVPSFADAQAVDSTRLSGRIVSVDSEPLRGATVFIRDSAGVDVANATTDDEGEYRIRLLSPGNYILGVRRIGYSPYEGKLVIGTGSFRADISLAPIPVVLDAVVSTAAPGYVARMLAQTGFTERMREGMGKYITRENVQRQRPSSVLSLLRPYLSPCTMIYVDGIRSARLPTLTVDEVAGVEIYRNSLSAPPQFNNPKPCGILVVWTTIPIG